MDSDHTAACQVPTHSKNKPQAEKWKTQDGWSNPELRAPLKITQKVIPRDQQLNKTLPPM